MGMIMWELTTGCKPFSNIEHDINLIYKIIDGKRPEITDDTPECLSNLMKKCWNSDPSERPSLTEIVETVGNWYFRKNCAEQFEQAEIKRLELIKTIKPNEKSHPGAVYISRPLTSLISKLSSAHSSSMISFNTKQGTVLCITLKT
jgi:hypothetical protein